MFHLEAKDIVAVWPHCCLPFEKAYFMKSFFIVCGITVAFFFADQYFVNGKFSRSVLKAADQMRHTIKSKLP